MVWVSTWTPESEALLLHKRNEQHMRWGDIALDLGKSTSCCHRRWKELMGEQPPTAPSIVPEQPRRRPLHQILGIKTHTHRQAILADPRIGQWDEVARVWSFNHLFRESITLAGAA